MSKYVKVDAAIVAAISSGHREFGDLFSEVETECSVLQFSHSGRSRFSPARVLDMRLQALRKAGKIRFAHGGRSVGGGWVLA